MPTVSTIVDYLEQLAPRELAAAWDNTGLLLGERKAPVQRIMTCLTVTPDSVAEAVEEQAQLIVSHHPILLKGAKQLTDAQPEGRMLLALARASVAVYSPHTAFDNTVGGINDHLAQLIGLPAWGPLRRGQGAKAFKVVVFVPGKDLQNVSDAMFEAGAGRIGQYSECSFRLEGTGTFFGSPATNPTVGQKGFREDVAEWRLEVVCPEKSLASVLSAIRRTHSYEEPAFDVIPLHFPQGNPGEGRVGSLFEAVPLAQLAQTVKTGLRAGQVGIVGEQGRLVKRIAIVCGAGGDLLADAVRARADVLLTGEMRFHDYLAAQAQDLALILPGHYASERSGVEMLAERLQAQWPELKVWTSRREKDPVSWIDG
jgi:dinuclear metal center YbgI/SA1388 family protein